jgi:signal transduction histidine kinase
MAQPGRGAGTTPLAFSVRTRWTVSTALVLYGIGAVALSTGVADDTDPYVRAHALAALPLLVAAVACTALASRVTAPEYSRFWRLVLVANGCSVGVTLATLVGALLHVPALYPVGMALFLVSGALWTRATVDILHAQAGRRSPSVDLVDAATGLLVLTAPGVLVAVEPLRHSDQLAFAVPFAVAMALTPATVYLSLVNLGRFPPGQRAAQGFGVVLAGALTVSLTLQMARLLGDLDVPVPVPMALHVLTLGLVVELPLWAHRRHAGRLDHLRDEEQVRQVNPMPYVGAAVLVVLAAYVAVTRHERPWGVAYLGAVMLAVVLLNAVRHSAQTRETRRLQAGLARMADERGRLLAELVRALDDDRRQTAAELHRQLVGSLATVASMVQTAHLALPRDTASALADAFEPLQADLRERAERLRRLLRAMTPEVDEVDGTTAAAEPGCADGVLATALRAHADELGASSIVRVEVDAALELDWLTTTVVYRIAQEAVGNAVHHAGASAVVVQVGEEDGDVVLEVADDGCGFDPDAAPGGTGVAAMRMFGELGRGELTVDSSPGQGTVVRARLGPGASAEATQGDEGHDDDQPPYLHLVPDRS